jgi:hypothetical protein
MNTISITVTQNVIDHLKLLHTQNQRQIAIQGASSAISTALASATKDHQIALLVGNRIKLSAGDTAAIWRSHNATNEAEYDILFDLLALRPDIPMLFPCELDL